MWWALASESGKEAKANLRRWKGGGSVGVFWRSWLKSEYRGGGGQRAGGWQVRIHFSVVAEDFSSCRVQGDTMEVGG